jgi:hypothetical protein
MKTIYLQPEYPDDVEQKEVCEVCDCEEPGIRLTTEDSFGKRITTHVCEACFNEPDYQECLQHYEIVKIKKLLNHGNTN